MLNFDALYLVKELIKLGTYRSTILQRKLDGESIKERSHVRSSSIIKSISLANMSQEHRASLNTSIGFPYMVQTNVFSELNEEQDRYTSNITLEETLALIGFFVEMHSGMGQVGYEDKRVINSFIGFRDNLRINDQNIRILGQCL